MVPPSFPASFPAAIFQASSFASRTGPEAQCRCSNSAAAAQAEPDQAQARAICTPSYALPGWWVVSFFLFLRTRQPCKKRVPPLDICNLLLMYSNLVPNPQEQKYSLRTFESHHSTTSLHLCKARPVQCPAVTIKTLYSQAANGK